MWLVGGVGLLGCIVAFILGFIPPSQLKTGNPVTYVGLLALATIVLTCPPFVIQLFGRKDRKRAAAAAALPDPA